MNAALYTADNLKEISRWRMTEPSTDATKWAAALHTFLFAASTLLKGTSSLQFILYGSSGQNNSTCGAWECETHKFTNVANITWGWLVCGWIGYFPSDGSPVSLEVHWRQQHANTVAKKASHHIPLCLIQTICSPSKDPTQKWKCSSLSNEWYCGWESKLSWRGVFFLKKAWI